MKLIMELIKNCYFIEFLVYLQCRAKLCLTIEQCIENAVRIASKNEIS